MVCAVHSILGGVNDETGGLTEPNSVPPEREPHALAVALSRAAGT